MSDDKNTNSLRDGYRTTFGQNLTYGTACDTKTDYIPVSLEAACSKYKHYMHAVHGMIYCIGEHLLWDRYKQAGEILVSEN